MPRFASRAVIAMTLAALASTMITSGQALADTARDSNAQAVNTSLTASAEVALQAKAVSVSVGSIPRDVIVVQDHGRTILAAHGMLGPQVLSPDYTTTKTALTSRTGMLSLVLADTSASPSSTAAPALTVGYGCLIQVWPHTNVHPCGYVVGNPVAQGIFNALKVVGSGVAVALCTAALVALGDNPGQAGSLCSTAVAILAGFVSLGSKCLFIVNTPSWLAGQILAVNC